MSQTVHVLGLGSALSSSLFVPQWGRCAGPQGLYPNAMCATQAHGLRPYSQGKNACAGIPHASGTVRACCYSHAVGYIHGVGDHMQLGQSIRQADSSHITESQEASVSNSRICRYPKEAPPEGGLGCCVALIEGEGLQQTEVEPGACLAGAELLAQYGKPRLKRTRRLRAQSRNLRMMVWLSALFRGSTTSRNPSPNSRPHCGSGVDLEISHRVAGHRDPLPRLQVELASNVLPFAVS